jgi:HJR/Mrr/RecB family endonuclease
MVLQVLGWALLISLPFIAIIIIKEIVKIFFNNLANSNRNNQSSQKQHEKRLKKLDKAYETYTLAKVDKMDGQEFELFVEKLFRVLEKDHILKTECTPVTGDHGCDLIIHYRDGSKLGIQCKRYQKNVTNHAVQEIVTSKAIYGLNMMMVFTNSGYAPSAKIAADANKVTLVDRDMLSNMINRYNEIIKSLQTKK